MGYPKWTRTDKPLGDKFSRLSPSLALKSPYFPATRVTIGNSVTSIGDYAFYACYGLKSINFQGTKAQWDAISKGDDWDFFAGIGSYTVYCSDGNITK